MNNNVEILYEKNFKKYYGLFSSIVFLNKWWFICSIIMPILLVIVFSFCYLSKSFIDDNIKWNPPAKGNVITNWLSQFYGMQQMFAVLFFGIFYFFVFISTILFSYFLFFHQLKNKRYRFALYSGLTRGEVFFILIFALVFYLLINATIVLFLVAIINLPIYESKFIACWEIFNIYLNIFIFSLFFILIGYYIWNRSQTLYMILFTIFAFIYILLMAIIRADYLILYLNYYAQNKYSGNILIIWHTKCPVSFLNILKYLPLITTSMTSYATSDIEKYLNLIYSVIFGSIIITLLYFKNKILSL
ncbi:hypothetical protein [Spiroplasma endosymbiont of Aspidapion aeneum]|uniref:hypothetical protein n=1 Tax=Spiroplasma endosymbiont of Aspidapion aeneum TaxID=3066276 RepID=UPI00313F2973